MSSIRSQYINYNHLDQQAHHGAGGPPHHAQQHEMYVHGNNGAAGTNSGIADPQYHSHQHLHYPEYDHYGMAAQYANSGPYGTSMGGVGGGYLNEFGNAVNDHRPESPSENSGSPSPLPLNAAGQPHLAHQQQQHNIIPQGIAYLQAPYHDEIPDYRITPSPGGAGMDPRYQDDPAAMVYGYVSSPYGQTSLANSGGGVNATYGTRPAAAHVYEVNLNGPNAMPIGVNSGTMTHIPPRSMYDDEDELQKHMSNLAIHGVGGMTTSPGSASGMPIGIGDRDGDSQHRATAGVAGGSSTRWRDPNLTEVISFLNDSNNVIKANAAAYLQHLCYMDDPNKQRTRQLGGIPPLVKLLSHDSPEVYRNACGALRNLSYGRQNDENKRAIKNAGGIIALINLLRRTTESEVKELVTGVIWNMSSCEDLKRSIIDDGVGVIVTYILIPHSGWDTNSPGDPCYSTVFRNASGVLRNVSSAGEYARTKLRDCPGLVDSLLYVVRAAIEKSNIGSKIVENCVCILRNLSYRCQEVEDPNYDKHPIPTQSRTSGGSQSSSGSASSSKGENLGCFGASKKKKDTQQNNDHKDNLSGSSSAGNAGSSNNGGSGTASRSSIQRQEPIKGYELLWQPEVVQSYLALLQSCSNPETLEAAAGAIQNLAACYWQPSIEIRAAVRKEKGLPILVELLRMEVDRVVCAVATALRNLAIDQRNKELIGKYAMRDLVQKLPSGNPQHDQGTSDDTIAAVLATLNEVIKKNAEFSRSLLDAGGVERLMNITRQRQKYTPRVLKFAGQVLFTMWQHQELRDVYKKHGWKEQDFVTKTVAARNAAPNSPNNANSTLNRPMASQGGTRYEDRTIKRPTANSNSANQQQQVQGAVGANNTGTLGRNNVGNNINSSQGGGSGIIYQRVCVYFVYVNII